MNGAAPGCSVIVVSYNTRELTLRCLASIFSQSRAPNLQVIVIDNASTDDSVAAIAEQFPTAQLIANARNVGFARAVNQALSTAIQDVVCLLNPDAELEPGVLRTLLEVLLADPQLGAVGPLICGSTGEVQHHCAAHEICLSGQLAWHLRLPTAYSRSHLGDICGPHGARHTQRLSGAALAIRRTLFADLGGFDERFFMYFEDADLCQRLRHRGFRLACVTQARVVHHQGAASGQAPRMRSQNALASELAYFRKHGPPGSGLALRVALAAIHGAKGLSVDLLRALRDRNTQRLKEDLRVVQQCLRGPANKISPP